MFYRILTGIFLLTCTTAVWGQTQKLDSLLKKLRTAKEDTVKVMLLRDIGNNIAHQDPHLAVSYWKQGAALGKRLNYIVGAARCYINVATGYSFAGQIDSSVIYSDTAIYYTKLTKDPNRLALVYLNRADNYVNLRNLKVALLYCDTALRYAEQTNDNDRMARIYHIIGDVYGRQQQFPICIEYFNKALDLYRKDNNLMMVGQVYSDFGLLYQLQHKYDSALLNYKMALRVGDSTQDLKNISTYNTDIGSVYLLQKKFHEAEPWLLKALEYAKQQENNLQLATVYTRFADLYSQTKNYAEGVKAGELSRQYAEAEKDSAFIKDATSTLGEAYAGLGQYKKAYENMKLALELSDSFYKKQYDAETATWQKNFEIGQKDKEIALLNKDSQLQQQQIRLQRLYLAGSIILVALAVGGLFLFISRHRLRQRMKELELRNRIAADLHDEVGSSLSSIHMLSQVAVLHQNNGTPQAEILSRVSTNARETMEKMGDIVWMIKPGESEGGSLSERMERFMYEMCGTQNMASTLEGTEALHKIKLSMQQRKNFYLVFKEALNNAVKYSGATNINTTINLHNRQLCLLVKDNGKGFDTTQAGSGNGLDNMNNRARELGGKLDIHSTCGAGTTVRLVFPV
jgi:two-component system sensor histidine kinase UhpB